MERLYTNSFSAPLEFSPSGSQYSNQEQFGAQLNTALLPRVFSLVVPRQTFPFLFENVWDKKDSITTILTLSAILLFVAVLKGLIHLVFFLVGRDKSFLPAFPCSVSFPLYVIFCQKVPVLPASSVTCPSLSMNSCQKLEQTYRL